MERLLALDYGTVRIGVAISDPLGFTAQPLDYIPNDSHAMSRIASLIQEKNVTRVIVGLPKDRHGGDSPMATSIRSFVQSVTDMGGVSVELVDERYSTVAASRQLSAAGIRGKRQRTVVDSYAAMFILQGVLDRVDPPNNAPSSHS